MSEKQQSHYDVYKIKMVCLAIHMADHSEKILQKRHLSKKDLKFLQLTEKMADYVVSLVLDYLH